MPENDSITSDHEDEAIVDPQPSALQLAETLPAESGSDEPSSAQKASEPEAQMIDIHPPEEPIHGWKTYLLHMSTIVLGLLIAIGLEQSVEAIHISHERQELRDSLRHESQNALADATQTEQTENDPLRWISARISLVERALDTHQPLPTQLPRKPHVVSSSMPNDPAWGAAKSSGLLSLLSQEEVEVYSAADLIFAGLHDTRKIGTAASYKRAEFEIRYTADPQHPGLVDLSHATPEELNTYIALLYDEYSAWDQVRVGCEYLRGMETAILAGDRDLGQIEKATTQFYSTEPR
jgi:hypothetical protein